MSKREIPSVYIKNIELFDNTEEQIDIKMTTSISDDNEINWSSDQATEHLKIITVFSANPNLNSDLTEGQMFLNKEQLMREFMEDDSVKIFCQPAKSKLNPLTRSNDLEKEFIHFFQASFKKSNSEIKVFCCVYFDTSEFLKNVNVDNSLIPHRYGIVTSETIMENNQILLTSNVFLRPNGNQYVGPIHLHPDKGYMVGAVHSETPHDVLTVDKVLNFKINDYTTKNYSIPATIGEKKESVYSHLNYSINSDGNVNGIFSINFRDIILYQTKYGYLLRKLSEESIKENINNIRIKNLEIIRRRVGFDEVEVVVRSFTNQIGTQLQEQNLESPFGSIIEIRTNDHSIKNFQFKDSQINKTSVGEYQYEVRLSFVDPTVSFVTGLIDSMRVVEKGMREYILMASRNKNYDYERNQTRGVFVNSQFQNFSLASPDTPVWTNSNVLFVKAMSYLYNMTEQEKINLTNSIAINIDPANATIFSLNDFRSKITSLVKYMENIFSLANEKIQFDGNRNQPKDPGNSRNVIFLNHVFKNSFISENYFVCVNYINILSNTIGVDSVIIQKSTIERRMEQEYKKFFSSLPNDETIRSLPSNYKFLLDLQQNYYSYLSPMELAFPNNIEENVQLQDMSKIKVEQVNKVFKPSLMKHIYTRKNSNNNSEKVIEEMSKPENDVNEES